MIPFTLVNDKMDVNISDPALIEKYDDTQDLLPPLVSLFRQLLQLGMALLSICCMILLGFADDVLGKMRQSDTLSLKCSSRTLKYLTSLGVNPNTKLLSFKKTVHCLELVTS